MIITSSSYTRSEKRCDYVVKLRSGEVGEIQGLFTQETPENIMTCRAVVKILPMRPMRCGNVTLSHLWKSDFTNPTAIIAVSPRDIEEPAIRMKFKRGAHTDFIATLSNTFSFFMH